MKVIVKLNDILFETEKSENKKWYDKKIKQPFLTVFWILSLCIVAVYTYLLAQSI